VKSAGSPRSVVVSGPKWMSGSRVQAPTPNWSLRRRSVASMSSLTQQIWVIGPLAMLMWTTLRHVP
jgi:hypothetical protein